MRSRLKIGWLVLATGLLGWHASSLAAESVERAPRASLEMDGERGGAPEPRADPWDPPQREEGALIEVPRIGASVTNAEGGGALVRSVQPSNPSPILEPGDVILAVNDNPVRDAVDLSRFANEVPDGDPLMLRVRREGEERLIGIRLGGKASESAVGGGPSKADSGAGAKDAGASTRTPEESGDAAP